MKNVLAVLAFLFGATSALAQDVAAIDPNTRVADLNAVVKTCEVVSGVEASGQNGNATQGQCVGATQGYIDALIAEDPALSDDQFDQSLTDLVTALVPLAQKDQDCNLIDDEIARAIKLASGYAKSAELKTSLVEIGQTVQDCTSDTTAALPDQVDPSPTTG